MSNILTIIGNGFDLRHGIRSKYSDFRAFVQRRDATLFRQITDYLPLSEDWADLEERLGGPDVDQIRDDASGLLVPYGAEDWSDSGHHDYEYEIGVIADALSSGLLKAFTKWIHALAIPDLSAVTHPLRSLSKSGLYFSFNYTSTLEKTYGIPPDRVLHIHGAANVPGCRLVLGHAYEDLPSLNEHRSEDDDMRYVGGNEIIDDYFKKTFKPADQLINGNKSFFDRLGSIENVFVLGHSLSDIDALYYIALIEAMQPANPNWTIAVRSPDESLVKIQRLLDMGVREDRVSVLPWDCF